MTMTPCVMDTWWRQDVINDNLRSHFSSIFSNPLMTPPLGLVIPNKQTRVKWQYQVTFVFQCFDDNFLKVVVVVKAVWGIFDNTNGFYIYKLILYLLFTSNRTIPYIKKCLPWWKWPPGSRRCKLWRASIMDLDVFVSSWTRISENVRIDVHATRLFTVTPENFWKTFFIKFLITVTINHLNHE